MDLYICCLLLNAKKITCAIASHSLTVFMQSTYSQAIVCCFGAEFFGRSLKQPIKCFLAFE